MTMFLFYVDSKPLYPDIMQTLSCNIDSNRKVKKVICNIATISLKLLYTHRYKKKYRECKSGSMFLHHLFIVKKLMQPSIATNKGNNTNKLMMRCDLH